MKRFNLCAAANGGDLPRKLAYLSIFSRGRAFAVFERLPENDRDTFEALETALTSAFAPATEENRRLAHSRLVARRLEEGEDLDVYVRDLKRLPDKAYPGIRDPLRSQQLVDQFLLGIPDEISRVLLIIPPAGFTATVARARELMLLEARREQLRDKRAPTAKVQAVVHSLQSIVSRLERLENRLEGVDSSPCQTSVSTADRGRQCEGSLHRQMFQVWGDWP